MFYVFLDSKNTKSPDVYLQLLEANLKGHESQRMDSLLNQLRVF